MLKETEETRNTVRTVKCSAESSYKSFHSFSKMCSTQEVQGKAKRHGPYSRNFQQRLINIKRINTKICNTEIPVWTSLLNMLFISAPS